MPEQPAPLLQIATSAEDQEEDQAFLTVRRALTMDQGLDAVSLAQLTDTLLTHCASFAETIEALPAHRCPVRGQGALRDWATLQADGPGDGPLGAWSYARQVAVVVRSMVTALREYRAATEVRAPYVGRPDLPPLTPSTP
ncbi:hypothetical protein J3A78_003528 [Streptomyces sp. PvR006]|uniref:DUF6415 family natural product biosynthesis protein n=1 Tax=Streptomyces sp. PvR006 TaxID=2817860 RepID=UPI001AE7DD56|nr:DUF6415 family natural product biosynthesis protein [Streptomyces sp. PvR006]MBP2583050.1 hypothetical protein [Streptomyces sp. PvR006]